eukprot:gene11089-14089_t
MVKHANKAAKARSARFLRNKISQNIPRRPGMAERMLKFVGTPQAMPDKRPAAERRRDFDEIYQSYAQQKAGEQASRCSQCGVPFCQIHCPLHNNIPDWLKLTAEGRLDE